jgi:hypothetical protein
LVEGGKRKYISSTGVGSAQEHSFRVGQGRTCLPLQGQLVSGLGNMEQVTGQGEESKKQG